MLSRPAFAKLNLSLEVLTQRSDNFHELLSVMQKISLHDDIRVEPAATVSVDCDYPPLPAERNIVMEAAHLLRDQTGLTSGCHITVRKSIPVGGGLGGGSSDAAATLVALNDMWAAGLDRRQLVSLGAHLGSDVPFFLGGGTALVAGRGEIIYPLPTPERAYFALANPNSGISTAEVYQSFAAPDWSTGECTRKLAARIAEQRQLGLGMNSLETAVFRLSPATHSCFQAMHSLAPSRTRVSGSGSTVFGQFSTAEVAATAAVGLRDRGFWSMAAWSIEDGVDEHAKS